jgi:UDP-N-acetylglucosamine--N-acetylmuramyl-(pentapeptide) pyrophosphoryl-undecaprenol N-acetylglucosamine transferase
VRARISRDDYVVVPSTERFGAALGAADLALARAGGSVWELAAAGLPAVLVPYPHATADHQTRNAEHFERAGGAVVVPDSELERAVVVVRSLIEDDAELAAMSEAMLGAARPDAAEEIAEELVHLAAAPRR